MSWITEKLSEIADIERSQIDPGQIAPGTNYLGLEHIEAGGRILGSPSVSKGDLKSAKFKFDTEHLLYGKLRPYLAKIALPDFEGICSTDILPVRPGPNLDRKFLAYYLLQPKIVQEAASRATGANLPRLSPKALAEINIPHPPIDEQRRIAAILDKADAIRRKREQALDLADELVESAFLELFGDPAVNPKNFPTRQLCEITEKFSDGPFGSNLKSSHYVDEGVRVVRLQNIGVGKFVDRDRAYISEAHFRTLKKHECVPGDVLVGTLGDPNLRACLLPENINVALNKADCVQIRPDPEKSTAQFICGLLNQPSTERMAQNLILGQTRARISMGRLKTLEIPVPPLDLQIRYTKIVNRATQHIQTLNDGLEKSNDLFLSLSQHAFRGEL